MKGSSKKKSLWNNDINVPDSEKKLFHWQLQMFSVRITFRSFSLSEKFQIRSVPSLYFTLFGLVQTRKTPYLDTFHAVIHSLIKSSVIRQKGESENGLYKKTKDTKFSEKRKFLTP